MNSHPILSLAALAVVTFVFLCLAAVAHPQQQQTAEAKPIVCPESSTNDKQLPVSNCLRAVSRYKDLQLAQAAYDNLFTQFQANEAVKQAMSRITELRKELGDFEKAQLEVLKLDPKEFYLDFSTGEGKPIPQAARPPAADAAIQK